MSRQDESRRTFLKGSALGTAAVATAAAGAFAGEPRRTKLGGSRPKAGASGGSGVASDGVSSAGVSGSVSESAISTGGALPSLYPGWVGLRFKEILSNENSHLNFLLTTLGANARPQPTFQNIVAQTPLQLAELGAAFCTTGAGAYLGASPYVYDKGMLLAGGSLGQVEVAQAGWISTLLNGPIVQNYSAFAPALTMQEVMNNIAPYLVSLNGGPPATFSTTPSPENDIAILNFALVLEYAEHVLYSTYVPKFF